jgi:hypothetical protein
MAQCVFQHPATVQELLGTNCDLPAAPEYVLTQTVTSQGAEIDTVEPTVAHILNEV